MFLPDSSPNALFALACLASFPLAARADTFDHIVVVIEENHSFSQVIGTAPYITSLANGGVNFTNFYAITHPSQPNYLEFFAGSDQGIKNDNFPALNPFTTPNLGAALIANGHTFATYSESLPSVGYNGDTFTTVSGQNQYVRKHNPVANWQSAAPTGNLVPTSTNLPFTSFPNTAAGYAALPNVSLVVPNEQNDMHDGSVAQGDTWLSTFFGGPNGYATWATTHNSLLIVTFDEDNSSTTNSNKIPTLFYGANLRNGTTVATTYTLHNLLRTLTGYTGTPTTPGMGAFTKPIFGALTSETGALTKSFKQATGGYFGTLTNNILAQTPTTPGPSSASIQVDGDTSTGTPAQLCLRFSNIFGTGATQVPLGATILSAKLTLTTDTAGSAPFSADTFKLYRILNAAWDANSTWNSLVNGMSNDGNEAATTEDSFILPYATANPKYIFDVTDTVQLWSNGLTNRGWFLTDANGTDGWRLLGENSGSAPALEITYLPAAVPEPAMFTLLAPLAALAILRRCAHRPYAAR